MQATNTRRLVNQYNKDISLEDAIALATGEAIPMWRGSWELADEFTTEEGDGVAGILINTLVDEEEWQAAVEGYMVTIEDLQALAEDFRNEAIAQLEDDLEEEELASLTENELAEMVTDDVAEAMREWLQAFNQEALEVYASYSCPLNLWRNLTANL